MPIVVAAAALTACGSPTQSYFLNGIGAELPARDIVNATELQRKYFNYLCQQAGLVESSYPDEAPDCVLPPYDGRIWMLIVYQGMNDIDRRCDAYLQWLDDKKRSKGPLISQIGSVEAATIGIIGVTGSATKAITVVAQAFELLTQSIENYHSRLLLEIDSSTVNSIVLRGRHKFRQDIRGRQFTNKPESEHVLRSYLRLCLPFAIETNINDYSTLGSLGISPDGENSINQTPVVVTKFAPVTDHGTRIRAFVRINPQNLEAVTNYLALHHGGMPMALFVRNAGRADQLKMIQKLKIP